MSGERPPTPVICATLLLCAAAFFAPFLLRGEHPVSFNLERAGSTAIPGGGLIPRTAGRFPRDNSPTVIHYPNACLAAECLRSGRLPLWNPYQGCGAPGLGGGQVYPFSPFLWPFYAHPTPRAFTLGLLLGSLFTGLGALLWMGRFLRGWALGLGAALWAFNPWTLRCIGFNNTWADWWLPWLLWSWHLALGGGRRALLLPALFVTGAVYCGHPESALLLAAASALYAGALWIVAPRESRPNLPRFVAVLASNAVLSILLCAVHWLPLLAILRESESYKASGAVGRILYPWGLLFNPNSEVFVGPLLFALAMAGAVHLGRRRETRPALVLPALGLLLALQLPFLGTLQALLSFGGRLPGLYGRSILWAGLAVCVASGVQVLLEERGAGRLASLRLMGLGLVVYAVFAWADYEAGSIAWLMARPFLLAWPAAALAALVGAAFAERRPLNLACFAASAALVLLDPLAVQRFRYPSFNDLDPLAGGPPAVARLKSFTGEDHGRFWADPGTNRERADLEPNLATLWRARDARMVSPLFLTRTLEVARALGTTPHPSFDTWLLWEDVPPERLGLLGVSRRALLQEERTALFDWLPVPAPLPRARIVHGVVPARDAAEADGRLRTEAATYPGGALKDAAILEGWTGPAQRGTTERGDLTTWLRDEPGDVLLRVKGASEGVLVLLDALAEGWRATVDGREAPIYPANAAFMGVEVPSGDHVVHFRYEPSAVRAGLWTSLLGWVLYGLLTVALIRCGRAGGSR